jgi:hypothetical protein
MKFPVQTALSKCLRNICIPWHADAGSPAETQTRHSQTQTQSITTIQTCKISAKIKNKIAVRTHPEHTKII